MLPFLGWNFRAVNVIFRVSFWTVQPVSTILLDFCHPQRNIKMPGLVKGDKNDKHIGDATDDTV